MTEKHRRFAELYVSCANATEAAKGAGYSEKTAGSQGQRLLKNVEISNYIADLQEQAQSERIANVEQVREFWSRIMRDPNEKTANRLKASEMLAKAGGLFLAENERNSNQNKCDVIFYLPEKEEIE